MKSLPLYRWRIASIVAFNLYLLAETWFDPGSVYTVLLLFWLQNICIGLANVLKILLVKSNQMDEAGNRIFSGIRKVFVAGFFTVHYGTFQLAYLIFLLTLRFEHIDFRLQPNVLYPALVLLLIATFLGLPENIHAASKRNAGLGELMFLPYLRILPMTILILINAHYQDFRGIAMFVLMKLIADVAMYAFTEGKTDRQPSA
jgi:hypothetical protein